MIRILNKDFSEVEERLYSTGNEELDELLEKAFCDGYEYAQKEFFDYSGMSRKDAAFVRKQRNNIAANARAQRANLQNSIDQSIQNMLPAARMSGGLKPNEKVDMKQARTSLMDHNLYGRANDWIRDGVQHDKFSVSKGFKVGNMASYYKRNFTKPIKSQEDIDNVLSGNFNGKKDQMQFNPYAKNHTIQKNTTN